ncbi:MAG: tetratricopeptide repeat protein [Bacteroidia bacterium]|nr:tetratricopeptide repeat protein [Bacteroidia bacterium]
MKKYFLILFFLLYVFSLNAQEISGSSEEKDIKINTNKKTASDQQNKSKTDTTANSSIDEKKDRNTKDNKYELAEKYYSSGDYTKSIECYEKSLKSMEESGDKQGESVSLTNMGIVYQNTYRYDDAIKYYEKSLAIKEELKDKPGITRMLFRIGNVYYLKRDLEKALDYFDKSLKIDEELKNGKDIAASQNNLGVIYYELKNYKKAMDYYEQAIKYLESGGNEKELAGTLNNLGNVNFDWNKLNDALGYYEKSLKLKEKINYQKGISTSLHNIANVYKVMKDFDKATEYYTKSNESATKNNDEEILAKNYLALSEIYASLKNCPKELECFRLLATTGQLLSYINTGRQISELQLKYDADASLKSEEISMLKEEVTRQKLYTENLAKEKETEIKLKNAEITQKNAEVKQQRTQKFAFIGGFVLMLVLSVVIFKSYRDKKKANILLAIQKHEIEDKNEELNQQNAEIAAQRDEIEIQKQLIEKRNEEVMDSIRYAKNIQAAILPPEDYVSKNLPEHFILFRPRDIVSGDFYWAKHIKTPPDDDNGVLIFCVADCTGHGVPGAFMSMLGTALLNEIISMSTVSDNEIPKANEMLNRLRELIIKSLHQTGKEGEQKDGMDIAFCILNLDTLELQYSGANNPLYIVRKQQYAVAVGSEMHELPPAAASCQLLEFKADKMPIGIYYNDETKPFTNHIIRLHEGDLLYIFSDGFTDQFGGPKGRKFLAKPFKETLLTIHDQPMAKQKSALNTIFENWMGSKDQIDDVTVLGMKI